MNFNFNDIWLSSPLVAVSLTGLVILMLEGFKRNNVTASFFASVIGLFVAAVFAFLTYGQSQPTFNSMFLPGPYGSFFSVLFLAVGLITVILSREYLRRMQSDRSEYYALMMFAIAGMMLMASAVDLIVIFLGIELMSLCLYVLAGFLRTNPRSNEAAMKYFLLGAFATGFLLYGIALVYGTTGSTNLVTIGSSMAVNGSNPLFIVGAGLIVMALSFKVAAAPFHQWAPDVYDGAPTSVTAFMSTAAKAAAFAAFMAVFVRGFGFAGTKVNSLLALLAATSMIVGNVSALSQSSVKRMLAYSSVAHAGYMLSGLAAGNHEGETGVMFYLAAYTLMNLGAFSILSLVEGENGSRLTFDDYAGFSKQHPVLAAVMALFMFSLAGIPPFAGFFGKYYVFLSAVKANMTWLAIVGVLTSLISVSYYLRLVVMMYFRDGQAELTQKPGRAILITVGLVALLVLGLGLFPSSVVNYALQVF